MTNAEISARGGPYAFEPSTSFHHAMEAFASLRHRAHPLWLPPIRARRVIATGQRLLEPQDPAPPFTTHVRIAVAWVRQPLADASTPLEKTTSREADASCSLLGRSWANPDLFLR